jgi:outer membrane protein
MTERYKAGLVSTFDLSTIEVQISVLRAQKIDFENNIHKLSLTFNSLAAREPEAPFNPDGGLVPEEAGWNKDALLKEAEALRVEFAQIQHQESLSQAGIDLARTTNKPTVAFSFSYEFRNGYMPNMNTIRGNWSALLSVSYPLFDGFRANAQVAQAESALRTVQTRRADLQRSVALEIETALADLQSTEQKLKIEQLKIKQAEDALRIAEERYQRGLLSATDFVESQNAVGSAKLNQIQLVYNHILGTYNLYRAAGKKIYE